MQRSGTAPTLTMMIATKVDVELSQLKWALTLTYLSERFFKVRQLALLAVDFYLGHFKILIN